MGRAEVSAEENKRPVKRVSCALHSSAKKGCLEEAAGRGT